MTTWRRCTTTARTGPTTNVNKLAWLARGAPVASFPPADAALREPDGLLAAGGDLTPGRLLYAYQHGIFPWYEDEQPVLWWSPDPRCVLEISAFHRSRSLERTMRRSGWVTSVDQAFGAVIDGCAELRGERRGTWITPAMRAAYVELHELGYARSVEVWAGDELVGGMYGVAIGHMFFGESMFSREADASKVALAMLGREMQAADMPLLDCQVSSAHLMTLGARTMPRAEFLRALQQLCPEIERAPAFTKSRINVLILAE